MFIDSHAHLSHCHFEGDLQSFINTLSQKLDYIIDIHLSINEVNAAKSLVYPENILTAAALYPDHAPDFCAALAKDFRKSLAGLPIIAVGETGLDFYHRQGTPLLQEALFRNQIELSLELSLPLIIHSRDAFPDTLRILKSYSFKKGVVMHCFSYGQAEAEEFLALGCTLSFAGNLTYPKMQHIRDALTAAGPDRILTETDSPYLSPLPHRGTDNNPERAGITCGYAAGLLGLETNDLAGRISRTFTGIFLPAGQT